MSHPIDDEEEVHPIAEIDNSPVLNVVSMMQHQAVSGKAETHIPTLVFSYLEIYELLRVKNTTKAFHAMVKEYFEQLNFLDLSPYFGYMRDLEHITLPNFSDGRSFFQIFQQLVPNRTRISFAYSSMLTCSALKHFLLPDNWSDAKDLQALNLYYCRKLTDKEDKEYIELASVFLECAPKITDLNLSKVFNLSIHTVVQLLEDLQCLARLSIAHSLHESREEDRRDEQVVLEKLERKLLREEFPCLRLLDCRGCTMLERRPFWQPEDSDTKLKDTYGLILRGHTYILGPDDVESDVARENECLGSWELAVNII